MAFSTPLTRGMLEFLRKTENQSKSVHALQTVVVPLWPHMTLFKIETRVTFVSSLKDYTYAE